MYGVRRYAKRLLTISLSLLMVGFAFFDLTQTTIAEDLASGNSAGTAGSPARSTIYDTINNTHWVFYDSGAELTYARSQDTNTWTTVGTLPYDTNGLSASFTIIGGAPYVFVAVECNDYDICLLRGTLTATAITFAAAQTALNGSILLGRYTDPVITIDNGSYLYVAATHEGVVSGEYVEVTRSTNTATGDISAWDTSEVIGIPVADIGGIAFAGKETANVMLVIGNESGHITAHEYDAGNWVEKGDNNDTWFEYLNPGVENDVRASVIIGQDIYFAGDFYATTNTTISGGITKYNPETNTFTELAEKGVDNWNVRALAAIGTTLYIGGDFDQTYTGDITGFRNIASYNTVTNTWGKLGQGTQGLGTTFDSVNAIAVHGTDLYIGGNFDNTANGTSVYNIVKYTPGTDTFSAIGGVNPGVNCDVYTVLSYGTDVYFGGCFSAPGGLFNNTIFGIAKYTPGTDTISPLSNSGAGLNGDGRALMAIGSDIYVGGGFDGTWGVSGGDTASDNIIKYTPGTDSWSPVGSGVNAGVNSDVHSLHAIGSTLYLGGDFWADSNGAALNYIAEYNTGTNVISGMGSATPADSGLYSSVYTMIEFDDDLYIGGNFQSTVRTATASNKILNHVAKYTPANDSFYGLGPAAMTGSAVGNGTASNLTSVLLYNNELYASAPFVGSTTSSFAKYSFATGRWTPLAGTYDSAGNGANAMVEYGGYIYMAGSFTSIGGVTMNNITRYDPVNDTFAQLGSGGTKGVSGQVHALEVVGTDIYVGGQFVSAGGTTVNNITKYTPGTNSFSALGAGTFGVSSYVRDIASIGTDVYLGGAFLTASGATVNRVVRYATGSNTFAALGTSGTQGASGIVETVEAIDGELYIGGQFLTTDGVTTNRVARYNPGTNAFSAMGTTTPGSNSVVYTIKEINNVIYIGGNFSIVDTVNSFGLATYDSTGNTFAATSHLSPRGMLGNLDDGEGNNLTDEPYHYQASKLFDLGGALYAIGGWNENTTFGSPTSPEFGNFSRVGNSVVEYADVTSITSTTILDGDVFVAYTDDGGILESIVFDDATDTWSGILTHPPTDAEEVTSSYNTADNEIILYWTTDTGIDTSTGDTGFTTLGDWTTPTTFTTGTDLHDISSTESFDIGPPIVTWTSGYETRTVFASVPSDTGGSTPTPTPTASSGTTIPAGAPNTGRVQ